MIVEVVLALLVFLFFVYWKQTRKWQKFKQRGIPYAEPAWPFGSKHSWKLLFDSKNTVSNQYRAYLGTELAKEKIFGIYGHWEKEDSAALMVNDLDLAKRMLIKDFEHFVDRSDFGLKLDPNVEADMLFGHSFIMLKGDDWKKNRNLMTPVFTTGKLKLMYKLLDKIGLHLQHYIQLCSEQKKEINSKTTFAKFALDGIASAGFGIENDSFTNPDNTFTVQVNRMMRQPGTKEGSGWELFKLVTAGFIPVLKYFISIENIPHKPSLFLKSVLLKTIKQREGSKVKRNDIIDLVLEQLENKQEKVSADEGFEDEFERDADYDMSKIKDAGFDKEKTIVSNAFLLFVAALDTTSSTLTFAVHYLIKYPEIQEKLREEILDVIGSSEKVSFEHIQDMKYLDNLIYETLRSAHPFAQILERECTKDYLVPGTNYVVRKGEIVNFSLLYERMKTEKFSNAAEFDPDNFDPANKPDSFSFLGFGQGPRNCIGKRYAMISIKIALVAILRNFRLVRTENTKNDLELFKFLAGAEVPFQAEPI